VGVDRDRRSLGRFLLADAGAQVTEKLNAVLPFVFYIAGSLCFIVGSLIAAHRTLHS
jgi:hypothetical protein